MALRGVRSSWLMLAMKSDWQCLAASRADMTFLRSTMDAASALSRALRLELSLPISR